MNVDTVELGACERRVEVTVPAEKVDEIYEQIVAQLRTEVKVPGFRPGKVPPGVIERRFGDLLKAETIQKIMEVHSGEAIEEAGLEPMSRPEVKWEDFSRGKPFVFSMEFDVLPKLEVSLDGIQVEPEKAEVSEDEVEERLEQLRQSGATLKPAEDREEPADGDELTIDYITRVDGGEESPSRSINLALNKDELLPELYGLLQSLKVGETGEKNYALPEDHPDEEVRGKEVLMRATLKEIKERFLPELDDDFARDNDYESMDDMRDKIRAEVQEKKEKDALESTRNKVVAALKEKNPVEIPPRMLEDRTAMAMQDTMRFLQAQGLDPATLNMGGGEMEKETRERTLDNLKQSLILETLAEQEGFTVSDEELEERLKEMAEEAGWPLERLKSVYGNPESQVSLKARILKDKALAFAVTKTTIHNEEAEGPGASEGEDTPAGHE